MTLAAPDLVVWRHGRTEWNDTARFQGQLDIPLDHVGHEQAAAAAPALAALRPAAVVSSDLARARDTAAYLGRLTGLDVRLDPRLREVDVGEWGGLTREEIAERFPEQHDAWLRGEDVRRGGGETQAELAVRMVAAVGEAVASAPGSPLVVVSHGGASRSLVLALLGLPESAGGAFQVLGNCRWATLVRHGDGWRLVAYNLGADTAVAKGDAGTLPVL